MHLPGGCPAGSLTGQEGGHAMLHAAGRVCSVHCAGANVGLTVLRGNAWNFRAPFSAGGGGSTPSGQSP